MWRGWAHGISIIPINKNLSRGTKLAYNGYVGTKGPFDGQENRQDRIILSYFVLI